MDLALVHKRNRRRRGRMGCAYPSAPFGLNMIYNGEGEDGEIQVYFSGFFPGWRYEAWVSKDEGEYYLYCTIDVDDRGNHTINQVADIIEYEGETYHYKIRGVMGDYNTEFTDVLSIDTSQYMD